MKLLRGMLLLVTALLLATPLAAPSHAQVTPGIAQPFVMLTSGQSNFEVSPAFAWSPNSNAQIWNWDGVTTHIGTAFVPLPNSTINTPSKLASDISTALGRPVCLINIAIGGEPISHWLSGTGSPDIYQDILNNITPALAACNATKIDMFAWWQGEADANPSLNASYAANFATMMGRYFGNSWFPRETPMLIFGIASNAITGATNSDTFNDMLQGVVNADNDKRRFVYTAALPASPYWGTGLELGHMTGQGYFSAGAMGASAFLNGPGRNGVTGLVCDPVTTSCVFGNPAYPSVPLLINLNTGLNPPAFANVGAQVVGSTTAAYLADSFGTTSFSTFIGRKADGTQAAPTGLVGGDLIASLGAQGADSTGAYASGNKADFGLLAGETWTSTHRGSYATLRLTANGTDTLKPYYRWDPGYFLINNSTTAIPQTFTGVIQQTVAADATANFHLLDSFGGGAFSGFLGRKSGGSQASPTMLLANDPIVVFGALGYDANGPVTNDKAQLLFSANENWVDATHHGTFASIQTTKNATDTNAEVVRFLTGNMLFDGSTSGVGTLTWPAALGSPTWTLPTGTGTFAVTASAPIVLNASTGNLTCPTCGLISGTAHGNSDYTILSTDRYVYVNAAFTAPRTWTLPAANSVSAGTAIWVQDAQNTVTTTNTLTIQRAGADTIDTSSTSFPLTSGAGGMTLISDGVSNWGTAIQTVSTGGTGRGSVTAHSLMVGNAGNPITSLSVLSTGQLLQGNTGADPSGLSTGTGVLTALAVNPGTAGAFVVNGGALGSPSSAGTLPAFTLGGGVTAGGNNITGVGALTATTVNGNTLTTGTWTLNGGAAKGFTFSNSMTLAAGADSQTFTFPSTSATIARTDAGQTFTGTQVFGTISPTTINAFTLGGGITGGGNNITGVGTFGATTINAFTLGGGITAAGNNISGAGTISATTFSGALTGHASLDLALTGGTLSGGISMGGNAIVGLTTLAASGALTFQSNGSTFAGDVTTGQQWYLGTTLNAPASGVQLTVSKNAAAPAPAPVAGTLVDFVQADTTSARMALRAFGTGALPGYYTYGARGTAASPAANVANDFVGLSLGFGYSSTGTPGYSSSGGAGFGYLITDATCTNTACGTAFQVYATPNSSVSNQLEGTFQNGLVVGASGTSQGNGTVNATNYYAGGTAGLATKTCTINNTNVATGITITIKGGIITGTTTC